MVRGAFVVPNFHSQRALAREICLAYQEIYQNTFIFGEYYTAALVLSFVSFKFVVLDNFIHEHLHILY